MVVDRMHTKYKFHVKRIQATGEGVRTPEGDVYLECYVGAEGPDENTTHHVRTMWGTEPQRCSNVTYFD